MSRVKVEIRIEVKLYPISPPETLRDKILLENAENHLQVMANKSIYEIREMLQNYLDSNGNSLIKELGATPTQGTNQNNQ